MCCHSFARARRYLYENSAYDVDTNGAGSYYSSLVEGADCAGSALSNSGALFGMKRHGKEPIDEEW
jgi:hypothetical protein